MNGARAGAQTRPTGRQRLADERLSGGITIRDLFAAWGVPLDRGGFLLPPKAAAK